MMIVRILARILKDIILSFANILSRNLSIQLPRKYREKKDFTSLMTDRILTRNERILATTLN
jgi:hypothetical protein